MNPRAALWFAFGASLALLACVGCAGQQVRTDGVVNLVQVRPDVWRSGQPVGDEWKLLYARGVRHSVTLSFPNERDDPDEAAATAAGIQVHRVYIQPSTKGIDIWAKPSRGAIAELTSISDQILDARGSKGIWLFHCKNGHDRTGWGIGYFVRMRIDGWTKKQAWDEMLARGYHRELPGLTHSFNELAEGMQ